MIPSIFLSLFFIATVIFIVNSHYRWTYFFAIALFVLLFSSMFAITGQWQRGLNFASVLFVVLMLFHRMKIHYYKQPLLISDFWLVTDWRNWETLLHYKGAIFGVLGLLGLLGYVLLYNLQGLLPRDPFILIVSAIMYGYAQYKYFKDKK